MSDAVLNLLAYLYGRETVEKIGGKVGVKYNKAGRVKYVYIDGKPAFVLRNNDGYLLPTTYGATFLSKKVVISQEVVRYVKEGRNVPAKYIIDITPHVRPYGEVAVFSPTGELVAVGRLLYSIRELSLGRGYAVRTRLVNKKTSPRES
ncbi:MAG: PUA domain-containing protein [Pyrobaculum sp.]